MLLLPGSLPPDRATLKALCDGLAALPEIASCLQGATVTEFSGSWSDAEREASSDSSDLCDGVALAPQAVHVSDAALSVAVATPLHAALGLTDITPVDPSTLSLSADESRALCEAADAHMREEGVRLHFVDAARWLVACNQTVDVLTERPDWIIGELLRPNLPRGRDARLIERWMNELQMLLHEHPMNIAREKRRLPAVNLVWLWGFGSRLNAAANRPPSPQPVSPQGRRAYYVEHGFANAMRNGDWAAWQAAWTTVAAYGLPAQTIIVGDRRPRLRLTVATPSIRARLLSLFKRKVTLAEVLTKLQQA